MDSKIIGSLFKVALSQSLVDQTLSVFSQEHGNGLPNQKCQLLVPLAPFAEILAAVHHAGLVAGKRELWKHNFSGKQQLGQLQELGDQGLYISVGKANVQIDHPGGGFSVQRSVPLGCEFLELVIPVFALLLLKENGIKHAQRGHQHRAFGHLLRAQSKIILSQFKITAAGGILPGAADQKIVDPFLISAGLIHPQRGKQLVVGLIVQSGVVAQLPLGFGAQLLARTAPKHRKCFGSKGIGVPVLLEQGAGFPNPINDGTGPCIAGDVFCQSQVKAVHHADLQEEF